MSDSESVSFNDDGSDSGSDFEPVAKKKSPPKKEKAPKAPKEPKAPKAPKAQKTKAANSKEAIPRKKKKVESSGDDDPFQEQHAEESPAGGPAKKRLSIERIYQKKTQLEHVLLRPDTYIGSVEFVQQKMWIMDTEKGHMVEQEVRYVPGLYKIFDEIVVNAADNKQRDPRGMTILKITVNKESGSVSVYNNGRGIPVVKHKEHDMYVPTLIFGHLLTSSNYSDEQKKTTGGRNGYGAKLCNIFSKKFIVETSCKREGKSKFKQTWKKNMSVAEDPILEPAEGDDYTKITFWPDFEKFKMEGMDDDIEAIFCRRAYDLAGATKGVKVYLNGKVIDVKDFQGYVELYAKGVNVGIDQEELKFAHEKVNDRWEIAVTHSENGFQQVSFVNSIATTKGGRHVDYVADQIVSKLAEVVKKKNKGGSAVKPHQIRQHIWIFVNCLIENPSFDSQTKENMTLQKQAFGSVCELSDKFYRQLEKTGIVESMLNWLKFKQQTELQKTTAGRKGSKLHIAKLDEANEAGKKDAMKCTLIITEGDSAKTLAVAGLGVVGRDYYGVFPLRGKMLNVREATHNQVINNEEITNLCKILGLKHKTKYETKEDLKSLRYGKLMIMTDQDQDGSHIKGLVINFIHAFWPSLLKLDFVEQFITPIVKVWKKKGQKLSFYSLPELEEWKQNTPDWRKYNIKYYKGLGTSTSDEAKEYFSDLERHRIKFRHTGNEDDSSIVKAFSKKMVEARKEWLTNGMNDRKNRRDLGLSEIYLYNKDTRSVSYKDFINKELILFSNADNERSIPSLVDGFKPGQRKIIFTCFKRKLTKEVKVAQLAGSVSELSAYHHGEVSLQQTILGLAQNFVGSNNINLLQPRGQFGTRLAGGKDSASARYIFTCLSPIARKIFPEKDDPLLNFLTDDNLLVEPEWYCPIIPMVLVNGADGIGTGWSTKIPNYDPVDLVNAIKKMLDGKEPDELFPKFKGFTGLIQQLGDGRYQVNGRISRLNEKHIEITELPIRTWTNTYKDNVLEPLMGNMSGKEEKAAAKKASSKGSKEKTSAEKVEKIVPIIQEYNDYNTDSTVRFLVKIAEDKLKNAERQGIYKVFKCQSTFTTTSMVLFDAKGILKKYDSPMDILKEFFAVRKELYNQRKKYLEGMLEAEAKKMSNQARFIKEKIDGEIKLENVRRKRFITVLIERGYDSDPVKAWNKKHAAQNKQAAPVGHVDDEENGDGENDSGSEASDDEGKEEQVDVNDDGEEVDYNYLMDMKIGSLLREHAVKLDEQRKKKQQDLEELRGTSIKTMWIRDLDDFLAELSKIEAKEKKRSEDALLKPSKGAKGDKTKDKSSNKNKRKSMADTLPSADAEYLEPELEIVKEPKGAKGAKSKSKDDSNADDEVTMIVGEGEEATEVVIPSPAKSKEPKEKALKKETKKPPKGDSKKGNSKKGDSKKGKKKNPWSDSEESEADMTDSGTEDEESSASSSGSESGTETNEMNGASQSTSPPSPVPRRSPASGKGDNLSDSDDDLMRPFSERVGTSIKDINRSFENGKSKKTNGHKKDPFDMSDSD